MTAVGCLEVKETRRNRHAHTVRPALKKEPRITKQEITRGIQLRVLLVEDEAIIAMATASRLEQEGYDVSTAHSGEHALELVANAQAGEDPYRLVLMDIDLGAGIDGVETARRILNRYEVAIVFLTNHTECEYIDRVRQITRYGYVLKSSGNLILRLSMEMAVDLFRADQLTRRQERELEAIYNHAPIMMFVVDSEARVVKANRRTCKHAGLAHGEADDTTIGRVMECIRASTDREACGRLPECAKCKLRAIVTETLESGTEFRDVPVTIEGRRQNSTTTKTLSVSTAPIERADDQCVLVSVIDLDGLLRECDHEDDDGRH